MGKTFKEDRNGKYDKFRKEKKKKVNKKNRPFTETDDWNDRKAGGIDFDQSL